jgi:putative transposase
MKKRFTEDQIIQILDEHRNGKTAKLLSREKGIAIQTLYSWKKKYGEMSSDEAKKLRAVTGKHQPQKTCGGLKPRQSNP